MLSWTPGSDDGDRSVVWLITRQGLRSPHGWECAEVSSRGSARTRSRACSSTASSRCSSRSRSRPGGLSLWRRCSQRSSRASSSPRSSDRSPTVPGRSGSYSSGPFPSWVPRRSASVWQPMSWDGPSRQWSPAQPRARCRRWAVCSSSRATRSRNGTSGSGGSASCSVSARCRGWPSAPSSPAATSIWAGSSPAV